MNKKNKYYRYARLSLMRAFRNGWVRKTLATWCAFATLATTCAPAFAVSGSYFDGAAELTRTSSTVSQMDGTSSTYAGFSAGGNVGVLDWHHLNVPGGAKLQFDNGTFYNVVNSAGGMSTIAGMISGTSGANVNIFNPNGILMANGSEVNVAGVFGAFAFGIAKPDLDNWIDHGVMPASVAGTTAASMLGDVRVEGNAKITAAQIALGGNNISTAEGTKFTGPTKLAAGDVIKIDNIAGGDVSFEIPAAASSGDVDLLGEFTAALEAKAARDLTIADGSLKVGSDLKIRTAGDPDVSLGDFTVNNAKVTVAGDVDAVSAGEVAVLGDTAIKGANVYLTAKNGDIRVYGANGGAAKAVVEATATAGAVDFTAIDGKVKLGNEANDMRAEAKGAKLVITAKEATLVDQTQQGGTIAADKVILQGSMSQQDGAKIVTDELVIDNAAKDGDFAIKGTANEIALAGGEAKNLELVAKRVKLGATETAEKLTVEATDGSIVQTGAVKSGKEASFTATDDITLAHADNDFSHNVSADAKNITLNAKNNLYLKTVNADGAFTATAGGNLGVKNGSSVVAKNDVSLSAVKHVNLNGDAGEALVESSAGNVTVTADEGVDIADGATVQAKGDLTVRAKGVNTDNGVRIADATAKAGGGLVLTADNGDIEMQGAGKAEASGTVTMTAASGSITQEDGAAIVAEGAATLTATEIDASSSANDFKGKVNLAATDGNAVVRDANDLSLGTLTATKQVSAYAKTGAVKAGAGADVQAENILLKGEDGNVEVTDDAKVAASKNTTLVAGTDVKIQGANAVKANDGSVYVKAGNDILLGAGEVVYAKGTDGNVFLDSERDIKGIAATPAQITAVGSGDGGHIGLRAGGEAGENLKFVGKRVSAGVQTGKEMTLKLGGDVDVTIDAGEQNVTIEHSGGTIHVARGDDSSDPINVNEVKDDFTIAQHDLGVEAGAKGDGLVGRDVTINGAADSGLEVNADAVLKATRDANVEVGKTINVLGTVEVAKNGTFTAGENIIDGAAATVKGDGKLVFNAENGAVTLDSANNDFYKVGAKAKSVTIVDKNELILAKIEQTDNAGTLNVTAKEGDINQLEDSSAGVFTKGVANFTTVNGDVLVNNKNNDFQNLVNVNAKGAAAVRDANDLNVGNIQASGNVKLRAGQDLIVSGAGAHAQAGEFTVVGKEVTSTTRGKLTMNAARDVKITDGATVAANGQNADDAVAVEINADRDVQVSGANTKVVGEKKVEVSAAEDIELSDKAYVGGKSEVSVGSSKTLTITDDGTQLVGEGVVFAMGEKVVVKNQAKVGSETRSSVLAAKDVTITSGAKVLSRGVITLGAGNAGEEGTLTIEKGAEVTANEQILAAGYDEIKILDGAKVTAKGADDEAHDAPAIRLVSQTGNIEVNGDNSSDSTVIGASAGSISVKAKEGVAIGKGAKMSADKGLMVVAEGANSKGGVTVRDANTELEAKLLTLSAEKGSVAVKNGATVHGKAFTALSASEREVVVDNATVKAGEFTVDPTTGEITGESTVGTLGMNGKTAVKIQNQAKVAANGTLTLGSDNKLLVKDAGTVVASKGTLTASAPEIAVEKDGYLAGATTVKILGDEVTIGGDTEATKGGRVEAKEMVLVKGGDTVMVNGGAKVGSGKDLRVQGGVVTVAKDGLVVAAKNATVGADDEVNLNGLVRADDGSVYVESVNDVNLGEGEVIIAKGTDGNVLIDAGGNIKGVDMLPAKIVAKGTSDNGYIALKSGGASIGDNIDLEAKNVVFKAKDGATDQTLTLSGDRNLTLETDGNVLINHSAGTLTIVASDATAAGAKVNEVEEDATLTVHNLGDYGGDGVGLVGKDVAVVGTDGSSLTVAAGALLWAKEDANIDVDGTISNLGSIELAKLGYFTAGGNILDNAGAVFHNVGEVTFRTDSGNVTLTSADNDFVGAVNVARAQNVTLVDKNTLLLGNTAIDQRLAAQAKDIRVTDGKAVMAAKAELVADNDIDVNNGSIMTEDALVANAGHVVDIRGELGAATVESVAGDVTLNGGSAVKVMDGAVVKADTGDVTLHSKSTDALGVTVNGGHVTAAKTATLLADKGNVKLAGSVESGTVNAKDVVLTATDGDIALKDDAVVTASDTLTAKATAGYIDEEDTAALVVAGQATLEAKAIDAKSMLNDFAAEGVTDLAKVDATASEGNITLGEKNTIRLGKVSAENGTVMVNAGEDIRLSDADTSLNAENAYLYAGVKASDGTPYELSDGGSVQIEKGAKVTIGSKFLAGACDDVLVLDGAQIIAKGADDALMLYANYGAVEVSGDNAAPHATLVQTTVGNIDVKAGENVTIAKGAKVNAAQDVKITADFVGTGAEGVTVRNENTLVTAGNDVKITAQKGDVTVEKKAKIEGKIVELGAQNDILVRGENTLVQGELVRAVAQNNATVSDRSKLVSTKTGDVVEGTTVKTVDGIVTIDNATVEAASVAKVYSDKNDAVVRNGALVQGEIAAIGAGVDGGTRGDLLVDNATVQGNTKVWLNAPMGSATIQNGAQVLLNGSVDGEPNIKIIAKDVLVDNAKIKAGEFDETTGEPGSKFGTILIDKAQSVTLQNSAKVGANGAVAVFAKDTLVKDAGTQFASAGGLYLNTLTDGAGTLTIKDGAYVASKKTVNVGGDAKATEVTIDNATVEAKQGVTLNADGMTTIKGGAKVGAGTSGAADANVVLNVDKLTMNDATLIASKNVDVNASGKVLVDGSAAQFTAGEYVTIDGTDDIEIKAAAPMAAPNVRIANENAATAKDVTIGGNVTVDGNLTVIAKGDVKQNADMLAKNGSVYVEAKDGGIEMKSGVKARAEGSKDSPVNGNVLYKTTSGSIEGVGGNAFLESQNGMVKIESVNGEIGKNIQVKAPIFLAETTGAGSAIYGNLEGDVKVAYKSVGSVDITHKNGTLTIADASALDTLYVNKVLETPDVEEVVLQEAGTATKGITAGENVKIIGMNDRIEQEATAVLDVGGETTLKATKGADRSGDIVLFNADNDFRGKVNAEGENIQLQDKDELQLGNITAHETLKAKAVNVRVDDGVAVVAEGTSLASGDTALTLEADENVLIEKGTVTADNGILVVKAGQTVDVHGGHIIAADKITATAKNGDVKLSDSTTESGSLKATDVELIAENGDILVKDSATVTADGNFKATAEKGNIEEDDTAALLVKGQADFKALDIKAKSMLNDFAKDGGSNLAKVNAEATAGNVVLGEKNTIRLGKVKASGNVTVNAGEDIRLSDADTSLDAVNASLYAGVKASDGMPNEWADGGSVQIEKGAKVTIGSRFLAYACDDILVLDGATVAAKGSGLDPVSQAAVNLRAYQGAVAINGDNAGTVKVKAGDDTTFANVRVEAGEGVDIGKGAQVEASYDIEMVADVQGMSESGIKVRDAGTHLQAGNDVTLEAREGDVTVQNSAVVSAGYRMKLKALQQDVVVKDSARVTASDEIQLISDRANVTVTGNAKVDANHVLLDAGNASGATAGDVMVADGAQVEGKELVKASAKKNIIVNDAKVKAGEFNETTYVTEGKVGSISFAADKITLENAAKVGANGTVALSADEMITIQDANTQLGAKGELTLDAANAVKVLNRSVVASETTVKVGGTTKATELTIDNATVEAKQGVTLNADGMTTLKGGAKVGAGTSGAADANVVLNVDKLTMNDATLIASKNVDVNASGKVLVDGSAAQFTAGEYVTIDGTDDIEIKAAAPMAAQHVRIANEGTTDKDVTIGGNVVADGNITVIAGRTINQNANLTANEGSVYVEAKTGDILLKKSVVTSASGSKDEEVNGNVLYKTSTGKIQGEDTPNPEEFATLKSAEGMVKLESKSGAIGKNIKAEAKGFLGETTEPGSTVYGSLVGDVKVAYKTPGSVEITHKDGTLTIADVSSLGDLNVNKVENDFSISKVELQKAATASKGIKADGNLSIVGNNDYITQDAAAVIDVKGVSTLSAVAGADRNGDINLFAGNDFGGKVHVSAENITLNDVNTINLGDVAAGKALKVSGQDVLIDKDATVTAETTADFTASRNVVVSKATVTAGGDLTAKAEHEVDVRGELGATTVKSTGGNVVFNGDSSVSVMDGANVEATVGDITLHAGSVAAAGVKVDGGHVTAAKTVTVLADQSDITLAGATEAGTIDAKDVKLTATTGDILVKDAAKVAASGTFDAKAEKGYIVEEDTAAILVKGQTDFKAMDIDAKSMLNDFAKDGASDLAKVNAEATAGNIVIGEKNTIRLGKVKASGNVTVNAGEDIRLSDADTSLDAANASLYAGVKASGGMPYEWSDGGSVQIEKGAKVTIGSQFMSVACDDVLVFDGAQVVVGNSLGLIAQNGGVEISGDNASANSTLVKTTDGTIGIRAGEGVTIAKGAEVNAAQYLQVIADLIGNNAEGVTVRDANTFVTAKEITSLEAKVGDVTVEKQAAVHSDGQAYLYAENGDVIVQSKATMQANTLVGLVADQGNVTVQGEAKVKAGQFDETTYETTGATGDMMVMASKTATIQGAAKVGANGTVGITAENITVRETDTRIVAKGALTATASETVAVKGDGYVGGETTVELNGKNIVIGDVTENGGTVASKQNATLTATETLDIGYKSKVAADDILTLKATDATKGLVTINTKAGVYGRDLVKIESVKNVLVDNALVKAGSFSVDPTTGAVTPAAVPGNGVLDIDAGDTVTVKNKAQVGSYGATTIDAKTILVTDAGTHIAANGALTATAAENLTIENKGYVVGNSTVTLDGKELVLDTGANVDAKGVVTVGSDPVKTENVTIKGAARVGSAADVVMKPKNLMVNEATIIAAQDVKTDVIGTIDVKTEATEAANITAGRNVDFDAVGKITIDGAGTAADGYGAKFTAGSFVTIDGKDEVEIVAAAPMSAENVRIANENAAAGKAVTIGGDVAADGNLTVIAKGDVKQNADMKAGKTVYVYTDAGNIKLGTKGEGIDKRGVKTESTGLLADNANVVYETGTGNITGTASDDPADPAKYDATLITKTDGNGGVVVLRSGSGTIGENIQVKTPVLLAQTSAGTIGGHLHGDVTVAYSTTGDGKVDVKHSDGTLTIGSAAVPGGIKANKVLSAPIDGTAGNPEVVRIEPKTEGGAASKGIKTESGSVSIIGTNDRIVQTEDAVVEAGGVVTLQATKGADRDGDIILANAGNDFKGKVNVITAENVELTDKNKIELDQVTTLADLTVITKSDDITQNAADSKLKIQGNANFTAEDGDVNLASMKNDFASAGGANLTKVNAKALNGSVRIGEDNIIRLGKVEAGETVVVNAGKDIRLSDAETMLNAKYALLSAGVKASDGIPYELADEGSVQIEKGAKVTIGSQFLASACDDILVLDGAQVVAKGTDDALVLWANKGGVEISGDNASAHSTLVKTTAGSIVVNAGEGVTIAKGAEVNAALDVKITTEIVGNDTEGATIRDANTLVKAGNNAAITAIKGDVTVEKSATVEAKVKATLVAEKQNVVVSESGVVKTTTPADSGNSVQLTAKENNVIVKDHGYVNAYEVMLTADKKTVEVTTSGKVEGNQVKLEAKSDTDGLVTVNNNGIVAAVGAGALVTLDSAVKAEVTSGGKVQSNDKVDMTAPTVLVDNGNIEAVNNVTLEASELAQLQGGAVVKSTAKDVVVNTKDFKMYKGTVDAAKNVDVNASGDIFVNDSSASFKAGDYLWLDALGSVLIQSVAKMDAANVRIANEDATSAKDVTISGDVTASGNLTIIAKGSVEQNANLKAENGSVYVAAKTGHIALNTTASGEGVKTEAYGGYKRPVQGVNGNVLYETFTDAGWIKGKDLDHKATMYSDEGVVALKAQGGEIGDNIKVTSKLLLGLSSGTIKGALEGDIHVAYNTQGDVDITHENGKLTIADASTFGDVYANKVETTETTTEVEIQTAENATHGITAQNVTIKGKNDTITQDIAGELGATTSASIDAGQVTTLESSGTIDLRSTENNFRGTVNANSTAGGDITLVGKNTIHLDKINANVLNVTAVAGDAEGYAGKGNITDVDGSGADKIVVTGTANLTAKNEILLDSANNDFQAKVNATVTDGDLTIRDSGDIHLGKIRAEQGTATLKSINGIVKADTTLGTGKPGDVAADVLAKDVVLVGEDGTAGVEVSGDGVVHSTQDLKIETAGDIVVDGAAAKLEAGRHILAKAGGDIELIKANSIHATENIRFANAGTDDAGIGGNNILIKTDVVADKNLTFVAGDSVDQQADLFANLGSVWVHAVNGHIEMAENVKAQSKGGPFEPGATPSGNTGNILYKAGLYIKGHGDTFETMSTLVAKDDGYIAIEVGDKAISTEEAFFEGVLMDGNSVYAQTKGNVRATLIGDAKVSYYTEDGNVELTHIGVSDPTATEEYKTLHLGKGSIGNTGIFVNKVLADGSVQVPKYEMKSTTESDGVIAGKNVTIIGKNHSNIQVDSIVQAGGWDNEGTQDPYAGDIKISTDGDIVVKNDYDPSKTPEEQSGLSPRNYSLRADYGTIELTAGRKEDGSAADGNVNFTYDKADLVLDQNMTINAKNVTITAVEGDVLVGNNVRGTADSTTTFNAKDVQLVAENGNIDVRGDSDLTLNARNTTEESGAALVLNAKKGDVVITTTGEIKALDDGNTSPYRDMPDLEDTTKVSQHAKLKVQADEGAISFGTSAREAGTAEKMGKIYADGHIVVDADKDIYVNAEEFTAGRNIHISNQVADGTPALASGEGNDILVESKLLAGSKSPLSPEADPVEDPVSKIDGNMTIKASKNILINSDLETQGGTIYMQAAREGDQNVGSIYLGANNDPEHPNQIISRGVDGNIYMIAEAEDANIIGAKIHSDDWSWEEVPDGMTPVSLQAWGESLEVGDDLLGNYNGWVNMQTTGSAGSDMDIIGAHAGVKSKGSVKMKIKGDVVLSIQAAGDIQVTHKGDTGSITVPDGKSSYGTGNANEVLSEFRDQIALDGGTVRKALDGELAPGGHEMKDTGKGWSAGKDIVVNAPGNIDFHVDGQMEAGNDIKMVIGGDLDVKPEAYIDAGRDINQTIAGDVKLYGNVTAGRDLTQQIGGDLSTPGGILGFGNIFTLRTGSTTAPIYIAPGRLIDVKSGDDAVAFETRGGNTHPEVVDNDRHNYVVIDSRISGGNSTKRADMLAYEDAASRGIVRVTPVFTYMANIFPLTEFTDLQAQGAGLTQGNMTSDKGEIKEEGEGEDEVEGEGEKADASEEEDAEEILGAYESIDYPLACGFGGLRCYGR